MMFTITRTPSVGFISYLNFYALPHHEKVPKIHFPWKKQIETRYVGIAVNTYSVELFIVATHKEII